MGQFNFNIKYHIVVICQSTKESTLFLNTDIKGIDNSRAIHVHIIAREKACRVNVTSRGPRDRWTFRVSCFASPRAA